jgi:hypothetical protein
MRSRSRVVLLASSLCLAACPHDRATDPSNASEHSIRDLEALTNLGEGEHVGPGGWDTSVSKRFFASRLSDCGEEVANVTQGWADENHFSVEKREIEPGRANIQVFPGPEAAGFYEVLYRLDSNKRHVHVSFLYYDKRGDDWQPFTQTDQAGALSERLQSAMLCSN